MRSAGPDLLPTLGIARELDQRGHSVAFLGQDTQRDAIAAARLPFTAYPHPADRGGAAQTAADRLRQLMLGTWLNTGLADDLAAILTREPANGVVIDCMLAGVLARSGEYRVPAAVLVHGLFQSVLPMRDAMLEIGNQLRVQAGLSSLDAAAMRWENKDLVLVTTLPELDGAVADPAPNVHYAGPVFAWPPALPGWQLPWPDDDSRPLVLASLSTMPGQASAADLQHLLDAVGGLHARVLVSTGAIPPCTLTAAANTALSAFVPHQAVLPHASLMISHGGHGSVTAALAHGVPLVCMPGAGADQPVVAARVEALGAGKTVSGVAPAGELADAASQVMTTAAFRAAARRLARLIQPQHGAVSAASTLEHWLASPASRR